MMNFGFGLAGIISPVVFGFIVERSGSWDIAFQLSVAICAIGAMLTIFMRPERPFIPSQDPVVRVNRKHRPGRKEGMETARNNARSLYPPYLIPKALKRRAIYAHGISSNALTI